MALGTFGSAGLRGAGYDDQNNNGYRDGNTVGEDGTTEPTCETGKHGKTKTECSLEVFQMQQNEWINKTYVRI